MKTYIIVTCLNIAYLWNNFIFVCSNIIYQHYYPDLVSSISKTQWLFNKFWDNHWEQKKRALWMNNTLSTHTWLQRAVMYWHVRSVHQGVTYHLARARVFPRNSVPRAIPCNSRWERKEGLWQSALYDFFFFFLSFLFFQTSAYADVSDTKQQAVCIWCFSFALRNGWRTN